MLDGVERIDLVERRVGKVEGSRVHDAQAPGHGVGHGFGIEVDADRRRRNPLYFVREKTAAATDLEDPNVRSRRQKLVDPTEVAIDLDGRIEQSILPVLIVHSHGASFEGMPVMRDQRMNRLNSFCAEVSLTGLEPAGNVAG